MQGREIRHEPSSEGEAFRGLEQFKRIVGESFVYTGFGDRLAYARDRAPMATFQVRSGVLPGTLPGLVVQPATEDEVVAIVRLADELDICVVPYGAGSGVLCGAVPLAGELMVDLKRLNRLVQLAEEDGLVTVQAGKNGGRFEDELQSAGYTSGHLPQSLHMSTVGGWAACRGAGQASTLYGKIEDIIAGLRVVLPSGEVVDVRAVPRRATGPSLKDFFVGSEGTLGIITQVTLRMWPLPQHRQGLVFAFSDNASALASARKAIQAGLRPAVVRVYDETESSTRTGDIDAFVSRPVLNILEFVGPCAVVEAECDAYRQIAAAHDGVETGDDPYREWLLKRYISYSPGWQAAGYFMDTIEISAPWSRLAPMYDAMRAHIESLVEGAHFGAHWSHVYLDGACQYMTVRLPPMAKDTALRLHHEAWHGIQTLCCEYGGSISHHHGSGAFRNPWMGAELGNGLALLQTLKDAIDPKNLFNPGKLGLAAAPNSVSVHAKGEP